MFGFDCGLVFIDWMGDDEEEELCELDEVGFEKKNKFFYLREIQTIISSSFIKHELNTSTKS